MAHLKTVIGGGIATLVALWASIGVAMQILLLLMALDLASGIVAAWLGKRLDSNTGWRGVGRKVLTLGVVTMAAVIEPVARVPLAEWVAGFYAVIEAISVLENTAVAGVPIPRVLREALRQWQELIPEPHRERPPESSRPDP